MLLQNPVVPLQLRTVPVDERIVVAALVDGASAGQGRDHQFGLQHAGLDGDGLFACQALLLLSVGKARTETQRDEGGT
jgi:hypothetical protein